MRSTGRLERGGPEANSPVEPARATGADAGGRRGSDLWHGRRRPRRRRLAGRCGGEIGRAQLRDVQPGAEEVTDIQSAVMRTPIRLATAALLLAGPLFPQASVLLVPGHLNTTLSVARS